jgi:DNA-directed RNA polymerase specialized sigma24 family protein
MSIRNQASNVVNLTPDAPDAEDFQDEITGIRKVRRHRSSEVESETFDPIYADYIQAIFDIRSLDKREVYDQFIRLYGALVVHLISRYNKVTANSRTRDIVQEIFLQLKQARAIERFLEQSNVVVPETITGEQAHKALGITWERFRDAIKTFVATVPREPWMVLPLKGKADSKHTTYNLAAVIRLGEMEYFEDAVMLDHNTIVPKSRRHFQNYLSKTVHNRFKNFCRGEERHNKERVWDTFQELRPLVEDSLSWESRLPDKTPCNQEARAELSLLLREISKSPAAARAEEIFEFINEGYDIEEAVRKLELSPDDLRLTQRLLRPWVRIARERRQIQMRPTPGAEDQVITDDLMEESVTIEEDVELAEENIFVSSMA